MQTYQKPGISVEEGAVGSSEIDVSRTLTSKKWGIAAAILLVVGGVAKFSRWNTSQEVIAPAVVEEHSSSQGYDPALAADYSGIATIAPTTLTDTPEEVARSPADYIALARSGIEALILSNQALAPKFVRLGFHDCVGGCDGCVDLTNPDNNGLDIPIAALDSIVEKYAITNLSRADIWALAALTGADKSQKTVGRIDFPMSWIGRVNCENAQAVCYNSNNQLQICSATLGPHRSLPSCFTTAELLHWFSDKFGFNASQTVALMGAHSIGTLSRKNSGFNGPQGWNKNKFVLSNSYYASLVGGTNGSLDSLQTKLDVPNWNLVLVNNSDIPNIPNRFQWQRSAFIMLDADISLVRNVEDYIDASTGEVTCTFLPKNTVVPACPYASVTLDFAAEYKKDNTIWLNDFRDVFSSMLVHGYDASGTCGSATCVLTSKLVS